MGAVEETRKMMPESPAPPVRALTAEPRSLGKRQILSRAEVDGLETRLTSPFCEAANRLCADILASEVRVIAAIDRLRQDLPLLVRNAVLEQQLAEKQRVIEDLQRTAH